jgi:hypothetical protein
MCIQTQSAMWLHKIIYYIRYAKINYKIIFLRYTIKKYLYRFWPSVTYVHFMVQQTVADTPFLTINIKKFLKLKLSYNLVQLN